MFFGKQRRFAGAKTPYGSTTRTTTVSKKTTNCIIWKASIWKPSPPDRRLFVFDNDAEGVDAFRKLEKLKLPANMREMLLPDLEEFWEFATRGPEGVSVSAINGRAAAIECYLDLRLDQYPAAQVTWSNFKKDIDAWHGVLDFKESYSKHCYDQPNDVLRNGNYDVSKLLKLIDALIRRPDVNPGYLRSYACFTHRSIPD